MSKKAPSDEGFEAEDFLVMSSLLLKMMVLLVVGRRKDGELLGPEQSVGEVADSFGWS